MKLYSVYIIHKSGYEEGKYSCYGNNKIEALNNYSRHREKCSFYYKHSENWKKCPLPRKGYPKSSEIFQNDNENTFLIMAG